MIVFEILMVSDTCLDPGVGQILITTNVLSAFYFFRLRGEKVEQNEYVLARKVEVSLVI